jgi:hypothetical protein
MDLGWQDAAVAMLAGIAVAWLVTRRLRARGRPGCEDCPGCAPARGGAAHRAAAPGPRGGSAGSAGSTLIPLSDLTRRD